MRTLDTRRTVVLTVFATALLLAFGVTAAPALPDILDDFRDDAIEVTITEEDSGDPGESDSSDDGGGSDESEQESRPQSDPQPDSPSQQPVNDPAPEDSAPPPQVHYCYVEDGELDDFCAQFSNTFCNGVGTVVQDQEPDDNPIIGNIQCNDPDEPEPPAPPAPEEPAPDEESDDSDDPPPPPAITQQDLAELPIETGAVSFEPELLGFGYINRHTNVFADVETQTISQTMLGYEVDIRAIPAEFHWDYGDGTTRTTQDPGAALPGGDGAARTDTETITSHVYEETGVFDVQLSTTFIGEYRIDGGDWTAIVGSTTIDSSPGEADIWRLSTRQVDTTCESAGTWGCSGPVELEPGQSPPKIFEDQYDADGNWTG